METDKKYIYLLKPEESKVLDKNLTLWFNDAVKKLNLKQFITKYEYPYYQWLCVKYTAKNWIEDRPQDKTFHQHCSNCFILKMRSEKSKIIYNQNKHSHEDLEESLPIDDNFPTISEQIIDRINEMENPFENITGKTFRCDIDKSGVTYQAFQKGWETYKETFDEKEAVEEIREVMIEQKAYPIPRRLHVIKEKFIEIIHKIEHSFKKNK